MKVANKLSAGLFLALSIAAPSIFFSTTAKAEPIAPSTVNRTATPIKVSPGLAGKVDTIRPHGKNPGDAAWEFTLTVKGDEAKVKPVVKPSAVDTFNSINKVR